VGKSRKEGCIKKSVRQKSSLLSLETRKSAANQKLNTDQSTFHHCVSACDLQKKPFGQMRNGVRLLAKV